MELNNITVDNGNWVNFTLPNKKEQENSKITNKKSRNYFKEYVKNIIAQRDRKLSKIVYPKKL